MLCRGDGWVFLFRAAGKADSGKDNEVLKSPKALGSIFVFHSRVDVPALACTSEYVLVDEVHKRRSTTIQG